jgi:hypothetical protein
MYKWLKSLQFPDEYVLNIVRLMSLQEYKLYGIKNH